MANITQINGYAISSSNSGGGGSSFPYTGSAIISGSLVITGSTTSTLGFTGSLFGTASWADNVISASIAATSSRLNAANTSIFGSGNRMTITASNGIIIDASNVGVDLQSKITVTGDVLPGPPITNNTSSWSLGSPTLAWNKIYVSNNSLHFVSGSTSSSIGFNNGVISFNNATVDIPVGSTVPIISTSSFLGNGVSSSFNINHGLNTRNLHITVYESSSNGETVYPDIRRINANTASIIFANPPSSNQYIVYISQ